MFKRKQEIVNPNLTQKNVAITVQDLSIIFNPKKEDEKILLKDFNYQFEKGKIYFIIGNSGCGKTSLVLHLNGLLKTKKGNIFVQEFSILARDRKIKKHKELRKHIGMVFQFAEYQLFKDTVEKDIMFGPINFGVSKEEAKKRAEKYLDQLGLPRQFLTSSPFDLSGGQKRKVAVAGILAIEPEIIIFDEPTAGLDPVSEQETLQIIDNLRKEGKTIIVITHVMDQVLQLADQVLLIHDQKLFMSGTPYEVYTNQQVLQKTTVVLPKVIQTIANICSIEPKFKKIYDFRPRTCQELAKAIVEVSKTIY